MCTLCVHKNELINSEAMCGPISTATTSYRALNLAVVRFQGYMYDNYYKQCTCGKEVFLFGDSNTTCTCTWLDTYLAGYQKEIGCPDSTLFYHK